MNLTDHFSLGELTFSSTGTRLGIDNTPNDEIVENLKRTAELLEKVRKLFNNNPLHIDSGYRCPELNTKIGGAKTSAHLEGRAADFTCSSLGTPYQLAKIIYYSDLLKEVDQLIMEGYWLHIAIPKLGESPRRDVLTATFIDGKATYTRGLK